MQMKIGPIKSLSIIDSPTVLKTIAQVLLNKQFFHIVLLDIPLFIKSSCDKELREVINQAHLVLPKSKLFVWGLKCLIPSNKRNKQPVENEEVLTDNHFNNQENTENQFEIHENSNITLQLIRQFEKRGSNFFFLGDSLENVKLAAHHIKLSFPNIQILGTHPAKQLKEQPDQLLEKLRKVAPNFLIVDIKSGVQEKWIYNNQEHLSKSICIGVDREIRTYAGKERGMNNLFDHLIKGRWLFGFRFCYFLILLLLYKTFLKRNVQCQK